VPLGRAYHARAVVRALERRSFVGRGGELTRLRTALHEVTTGHGRAVIVAGEAGIGKSRLLDRLAEVATADGAVVFQGACLETVEGAVPYAPFVEILRDLVRATPSERLPALLGPGRAELARLIPELALRAADVPAPVELDRAAQADCSSSSSASSSASPRPTRSSSRSRTSIGRRLDARAPRLPRPGAADDRVLIVLALRIDGQAAAIGNLAFIAELEREEHVDRLELGPFGATTWRPRWLRCSMANRTRQRWTAPRPVGRQPFYVEELILAGGDLDVDLPPVLRDVLVARVAALSEPAHGVLRAAAAAGRQVDDELLASVLEMPVRELAGALREAVTAGILARRVDRGGRDGPAIEFRHALLQEVVLDELFPGERIELHAAFATALEARAVEPRPGGEPAAPPAEIARHWDAAHRPDRALGPTIEAGRRRACLRLQRGLSPVGSAGALAAAARRRGRPCHDGDELLEHAADAAVLAGEYRSAIRLGEAAIATGRGP
jgi:hypothetical protein